MNLFLLSIIIKYITAFIVLALCFVSSCTSSKPVSYRLIMSGIIFVMFVIMIFQLLQPVKNEITDGHLSLLISLIIAYIEMNSYLWLLNKKKK